MAARALPALIALLTVGAVHAQAIHKCRNAEGRIAYQDQPCPVEALPLPPIDGPPSNPYVPNLDARRMTAESADDRVTNQAAQSVPSLPARYRCLRVDGKSYVSDNPVPPVRYVPAWVVGATSTTSNLPRTPARKDWDRTVGGAYVRVQDRCEPMGRAALCAHWREGFDAARRGSRSTFFDEREALEREAEGLRESLRTHCGG